MLQIKSIRSYTSPKGNKVFVYAVTGAKENLEKFKTVQGDNYREDEKGTALWFTTRSVGPAGELIITTNNKVVADMSKFDQAASLAKQYGGNLGEALAKAAVEQLLGSKPAVVQDAQATPAKQEDLGDI